MKKVTVFSEEALNKLQENIEQCHQKLLRQLEARDMKKKRNNLTQTSNSKVINFFLTFLAHKN